MTQNKALKRSNLEHFAPALEGFAGEYDIELQVFGQGIHWRLTGGFAVLDIWPTTGKYWIKEVPFGKGFSTDDRSGVLPYNYLELDKFLRGLFL